MLWNVASCMLIAVDAPGLMACRHLTIIACCRLFLFHFSFVISFFCLSCIERETLKYLDKLSLLILFF